MSNNPSEIQISVCMATYNGDHYIKKQLSSILIQLGPNDEVIISDDSSSDNTVEIIESFNDSRIKLHKNQLFRSAVLNFEETLKHAKGNYIFLSDQDDIWLSNKIVRMVEELQSFDLVVSDCNFIDSDDKIVGASNFKLYRSGPGVLKNFIKNTYLGNCMAFNRKVLQQIMPFPSQLIVTSKMLLFHDVWIGLIANLFFRVKFIPEVLSSYRRHGNNASPTEMNAVSPNKIVVKLHSRFLLSIALFNRIIRRFFS
jgi:glycosyltransferase involved in cell wall biosynthesis